LQPLNAFGRPSFAMGIRLGELLSQQFEIETERRKVILDLVNKPAGEFGEIEIRG
jgi:hypothetical protein